MNKILMQRFSLNRQHHDRGEKGFAMMSVIMLLLVISVLASIVLSVVISQVQPTLFTEKNGRTLAAAQAGMDAATSQMRNATAPDGTGGEMGDIHKLPCTVTGTVDGTGGETSYQTTVDYFLADPFGKDDAWRASNELECYVGTGPSGGVRAVPRYAVITSEGFDATSTSQVGRADRVVESTYTFQLTTRRIGGGMILDSNSSFCLVADSPNPGSLIRYQAATSNDCDDQDDLNSWTWADDYMLHLSSTDVGGKVPLCMSGRATGSSPISMTLQVCTTTGQDPLGQRLQWTGDYTWKGQNAANTAAIESYIVNQDNSVDANDRLSVSTSTAFKSVTPLPAVGKGNASKDTNQIVNFNQYGRCLDVTNETIGYAFQIAYTCKQDPSGKGAFKWNHKWYYEDPGDGVESVLTQLRVIPPSGTTHCLISTATKTNVTLPSPPGGTQSHLFPRFVTSGGSANCSGTLTFWTRYAYHDDEKKSYTFQDSNGKCLSAAGPKTLDVKDYTSIIVETCTGSGDQKWNVPEDPTSASLGDFTELTGTG